MDITVKDILEFDESLEIFRVCTFLMCKNRDLLKKITDYMSDRPKDKFISIADLLFEEGFGSFNDYYRHHLGWINGKFVLFEEALGQTFKVLFDGNEYYETVPSEICFRIV